ncbi:hypothetical protein FKM82_015241 [Ascaphus truei]
MPPFLRASVNGFMLCLLWRVTSGKSRKSCNPFLSKPTIFLFLAASTIFCLLLNLWNLRITSRRRSTEIDLMSNALCTLLSRS